MCCWLATPTSRSTLRYSQTKCNYPHLWWYLLRHKHYECCRSYCTEFLQKQRISQQHYSYQQKEQDLYSCFHHQVKIEFQHLYTRVILSSWSTSWWWTWRSWWWSWRCSGIRELTIANYFPSRISASWHFKINVFLGPSCQLHQRTNGPLGTYI